MWKREIHNEFRVFGAARIVTFNKCGVFGTVTEFQVCVQCVGGGVISNEFRILHAGIVWICGCVRGL